MSTVRSSTNPIAVSAADALQSDDETSGSPLTNDSRRLAVRLYEERR